MPNNIDFGGFATVGFPALLDRANSLTLKGSGNVPTLDVRPQAPLGAAAAGATAFRVVGGGPSGGSQGYFTVSDLGTVAINGNASIASTMFSVAANGSTCFSITYLGLAQSTNYNVTGATSSYTFNQGTGLYGSAASTGFAVRYGTTAQKVDIYGTYTDASNYVRASLAATSTTVTLAAETAGTGTDNVPVVISPAGTSQVEIGNGVQFTEMTAPSAPAANKVILYAVDNGAGKTQLMALFASGAAQQVAIEP